MPLATLKVYTFDMFACLWKALQEKTWHLVKKADEDIWLHFMLPPVTVAAYEKYAFKLLCTGGMLAIADAPGTIKNPYAEGKEWTGSPLSAEGKFNEDFDFAF